MAQAAGCGREHSIGQRQAGNGVRDRAERVRAGAEAIRLLDVHGRCFRIRGAPRRPTGALVAGAVATRETRVQWIYRVGRQQSVYRRAVLGDLRHGRGAAGRIATARAPTSPKGRHAALPRRAATTFVRRRTLSRVRRTCAAAAGAGTTFLVNSQPHIVAARCAGANAGWSDVMRTRRRIARGNRRGSLPGSAASSSPPPASGEDWSCR